jgi:hypothetical protein
MTPTQVQPAGCWQQELVQLQRRALRPQQQLVPPWRERAAVAPAAGLGSLEPGCPVHDTQQQVALVCGLSSCACIHPVSCGRSWATCNVRSHDARVAAERLSSVYEGGVHESRECSRRRRERRIGAFCWYTYTHSNAPVSRTQQAQSCLASMQSNDLTVK